MKTYVLLDLNNLLFRAKHVTSGSIDLKVGMAINIVIGSIRKVWEKFEASHVIVALDSKSWRREVFTDYKLGRREAVKLKTSREIEDDEVFTEAFNDLIKFFNEKTNMSVIQAEGLEADDIIARWIHNHQDDRNIIISSDSDFFQLLEYPNAEIFNGITNMRITARGVYDHKDKNMEFKVKNDGKIRVGKQDDTFIPESAWWQWAVFSKMMRGDASDGIMTAYPKIRQTKIREAYENRIDKGFIWNNIMLQTWTDHNDRKVRVLDAFNNNKMLIDLVELPPEIAEYVDQVLDICISEPKNVQNIGIWFLKFCNLYGLNRMEQNPRPYLPFLTSAYKD